MQHVFTCSKCKQTITYESEFTTGYGVNDKGEKVCFACCGKEDEKNMEETGKAMLYLSFNFPRPMEYHKRIGTYSVNNGKVTNWPGTLSIPIHTVKVGHHNMAGRRYDVWFKFRGKEWHGVQYGDNTQIVHCNRLK